MIQSLKNRVKNRTKKLLGKTNMFSYNLDYEKKVEETKNHLSKIIHADVDKIHELDLDDITFSAECIMSIHEKLFEFISNTFNTVMPMMVMMSPAKYVNQFSFWVEEEKEKKIVLFWQPKEKSNAEFVFQIPGDAFQIPEIKKSLIN